MVDKKEALPQGEQRTQNPSESSLAGDKPQSNTMVWCPVAVQPLDCENGIGNHLNGL